MLRIFTAIAAVFLVVLCGGLLAGGYMLWQLNQDLPDYSKLADYEPPVMTRVHAGDGKLIAEYARERRLYVPINVIPKRVIEAFLAAEDKNFYSHGGVDATGIARAMFDNIINIVNDRRLAGASTITQQVARNFLLNSDRTLTRKLKEALIALRLEKAYTKDKILELYLNEIYLGMGGYGVAAAAQIYFDQPLDKLTIAQVAYLAALPKGPANYQPYTYRDRAIARRNWVISRMQEDGFITAEEGAAARAEEFTVTQRPVGVQVANAEYFVEEVRRELYAKFGEQKLYEGGLSVRTTIDTRMQGVARTALRKGLTDYDRRHGWRGPVAKLDAGANWHTALQTQPHAEDLAPWTLGVVLDLTPQAAKIGLRPEKLASGKFSTDVKTGTIPFSEISWARASIKNQYLGAVLKQPSDALAIGDVIYVEPIYKKGETTPDHYALRQVPAVNGAVVAMDPHTGRVLAMQGGFSFDQSEFNRAVQALRQPGSSFKPFVYAAALDHGFTPASLVLDAPFVMDQGAGLALWKPENYEHNFYGPSTLRFGLEHSRNVMTVRLAQNIGMDKVADYAHRFGITDNMSPVLSMALGAGETTLIRLTAAYAILDNGGRKVTPTFIDRIQDRWGRTIYKHDNRPCQDCNADWAGQQPPELPDTREEIENPQTAYQMTSILEGVIQRGTGSAAKAVPVPLAGKTGTSNDERDAWFMGYSPNLVVGVFVGYDNPTPLGHAETGGRTAAPIFRDIMMEEVGKEPAIPFRIPPGINLVKVDPKTGQLASSSSPNVILEAFKDGTDPQMDSGSSSLGVVTGSPVSGLDGAPAPSPGTNDEGINSGTGGLY
ncbi:MAG: penicillin-binding protein 1A [Parvibaculum sp.]|uniref:penicillin-binding protein 1A n=1 Tax=Parvibaculum sp. TaxID=2024848 RepID=UPI003C75D1B6